MFDVQEALAELDLWRLIPREDDAGHILTYHAFIDLAVLSRIAAGDTEDLINDVVALLEHRGLPEKTAIQAMDDIFWGIGTDWGEKWAVLHRSP